MELMQITLKELSIKIIFFTVWIDGYYIPTRQGGAEESGGEGMRGRLGERYD